jgi:hypothetical protein
MLPNTERHDAKALWYIHSGVSHTRTANGKQSVLQAKYDAFKKRFPNSEELGSNGICTMAGCTKPFLFASGLSPEQVQSKEETWSPCLQEVALDTAVEGLLYSPLGMVEHAAVLLWIYAIKMLRLCETFVMVTLAV